MTDAFPAVARLALLAPAPSAYLAITRVQTMPFSSMTTARVAPQTAHPLTARRLMPRLCPRAGRVSTGRH